MATRGFGYFRITIPWYGVEYSPGQYNWQGDDALLAAAAEHHIHVLMGILGAPRWDSTDPAADVNDNYPPADPSVFGQFAALAAQRYGPNGTFWRDNPTIPYYPVRSWEIWNEPNLADYWLPAPDATAYTQLLRASYVAIKQVDPHAIVVVAGMPFYGPADETAFITQMYKAGARNHFDAFALDEYAPTLAVAEQHLVLARRLMNRFHDRRKAIWILELGFAGGYPDAYISNQNKAAKTSAKFLVWLRKMRGALKLKEVFWYGWLDGGPPGGDPRYWAYNLGLFTSSMQPKPVLPVVTRAARLFDR
jgi:hypothetical protein